jgi:hypothetical protein
MMALGCQLNGGFVVRQPSALPGVGEARISVFVQCSINCFYDRDN